MTAPIVFGSPEAAAYIAPHLEPCPFCGSGEVLIKQGASPGDGAFFAECQDCEACGPWHMTKAMAANEWNKREAQP